MADLQDNTEYSKTGTPNVTAAYAAARKAILSRFSGGTAAGAPQTGWQGQGTTKIANRDDQGQPIANLPFAMPNVNPSQPQYAAPQTYQNLGTGEQTQGYVPPDYQTAQGIPGKYNSPSDVKNLRFRNVPENLGAGQYVVDTEQPGQMIRSKRAVRPDQYEGSPTEYASDTVGELSKTILGGAKPASEKSYGMGFQIDHIVPLWLGGADTPENKQLLDPFTHEKKTKVQAVALTLLQAKKITPAQAKMMAIRWREHDDSGIKPLNNGFADLSNAEEVSKRWQVEESQVKPTKWKDVWNEMKNLKNFGQETLGTSAPAALIREFVKGGASTLSFGYIPYEMDDDYKDGAAKAAGFVGSVGGNILGFIPAVRGLGLVFGGMNKSLRAIGALSKIAGGVQVGSGLASKMGFAKNAGEATKILIKEAPKLESTAKWVSAFKQAGLFTTYGQLSKEGLLGQAITGEENDWKERFLWDAVSGGSMGKWSNASQAGKDAMKVAGLSTTLDAMLRADDPDWTIESSLANGLTMGGIHYLGLKSGAGVDTSAIRRDVTSKQIDPKIKEGLFSVAKYNPQVKAELQKTSGLSAEALEAEIEKANKSMLQTVAGTKKSGQDIDEIDYITATNNYVRNLFYARQAYISNLPPAEQHRARVEDLSSMVRHLARNERPEQKISGVFATLPERLETSVPKSAVNLATDKKAADELASQGIIRIPLAGTEANSKIKSNVELADQLNKEGRLGGEGVVIRDPSQGALINTSLGGKYANPENHSLALFPYYTDKTKSTFEGWLHLGNLPEAGYVERANISKPKFSSFDVEKANKDIIGDEMAKLGESVRRVDLEWQSPETAGGRASAVIQMRPDSSERSKVINEAWNARTQERLVNETISTLDTDKMAESGMPVEWMNTIVKDFKIALATGDPEKIASKINTEWGKNTITPEGARAILDNPTFTVGEMFDLVRKSPVWKRASYILDGQMTPSKEAASAYREYRNTNIKTVRDAPQPTEIKAELPKKVATAVKTAKPEVVKSNEVEFPQRVVTLGGEDTGGLPVEAPIRPQETRKAVNREIPKVDQKIAPESISEAVEAAVKAVKKAPISRTKPGDTGDPFIDSLPQRKGLINPVERPAQVSEINAPTGQIPPVLRTLQAVPEKVAETPAAVETKRFTDKGEEIIKIPQSIKSAYEKPGSQTVTKELDKADLRRLESEVDPFTNTDRQSLIEKAFSPSPKRAEGEYLENPAEGYAIKILRTVGEDNVIPLSDGSVRINPKSGLTGVEIREKSGLSNLEFMEGVDYMSSTIAEIGSRGRAPGKVLNEITFRGAKKPDAEIVKTEKGTRVMSGGKTSYPGSGTTDWMAARARNAEEVIRDKKNPSYEDGLALGFTKALEKITGKAVDSGNLHKVFGVDGFFAKISERAKPMMDKGGREVTQPRGLQKSRVLQERGRIGEISPEARESLFRKRLDEEGVSRSEKDNQDLEFENSATRADDGPGMGKSMEFEQGETFGLKMEDRAQSMKENIPVSELEFSLPGMALRTSGEKVNVTDGIKDGLLLARQFRDHYWGLSKQKPGFVDFMEMEKKIRASYDPEFKKILPLMKKSELRRVSKAIMQKTAPEGTVIKTPNNPAYEKPASPLVDVKAMIKKHDGADPEGSTKIMETILRKQGYKKKNTGKTYENIWENKKYLNILRATKDVKIVDSNK